MRRNSTSSSRANGRSRQIETHYEHCPLCGSPEIHLGRETITVSAPTGRAAAINAHRWKCERCGEAFLTPDARRRLDDALRIG